MVPRAELPAHSFCFVLCYTWAHPCFEWVGKIVAHSEYFHLEQQGLEVKCWHFHGSCCSDKDWDKMTWCIHGLLNYLIWRILCVKPVLINNSKFLPYSATLNGKYKILGQEGAALLLQGFIAAGCLWFAQWPGTRCWLSHFLTHRWGNWEVF